MLKTFCENYWSPYNNLSFKGLRNVADSIVNATDDVIQFGENTEDLRSRMVAELETGVCTPDGRGGVADNFDAAVNNVVGILTILQDFSKNDLTELRNTFEMEFTTLNDAIYDNAENTESYAEPLLVALPVMMLGLVLGVGSWLAWKGPYIKTYFTVQTWIVLPIFSLVVILMAFVLALTGTLLVANSDVCLGGNSSTPEGFVEDVLIRMGVDGDAMDASQYYIINVSSFIMP